MQNIAECLQRQTFKDFEIIFVVDKKIENYELRITNYEFLKQHNVHCITEANSDFRPQANASYNRNFGIKQVKGEYIQLMDDDERFEDDYLERSLTLREHYRSILKKDFVLTPTLMYRKTWHIQNQGFSYFNYRLSRPIPQNLGDKEWEYIQMYSGNSLLAPAYIFKEILFDEKLDFVYEDLDFTYRIHRAKYPLIVLRDLRIYHMERNKTILEQARVGNEYAAYRKAKHRILFVKKYGTLFQKIQFYLLGFRGQPLWLILKVLRFAPGKQKRQLIWAIVRGTFATL